MKTVNVTISQTLRCSDGSIAPSYGSIFSLNPSPRYELSLVAVDFLDVCSIVSSYLRGFLPWDEERGRVDGKIDYVSANGDNCYHGEDYFYIYSTVRGCVEILRVDLAWS